MRGLGLLLVVLAASFGFAAGPHGSKARRSAAASKSARRIHASPPVPGRDERDADREEARLSAGIQEQQNLLPETPVTPVEQKSQAPVLVASPPPLTLASGLILDAETGRVLWAKDEEAPRYPASTTKMMTAMLLLEKTRPEEVVEIPREAAATRGSGIRVRTGQKYTMETLIKGILIASANDACVAGAIHAAGSVEAFVKLMNERAAQLGASSTHFANPHGLHDPAHVTTARDLAVIALAAMKDPEFRRIVGTAKASLGPIGGRPKEFKSTDTLLGVDPTVRGIKTGWTNPAGRCFVGWHEKDGIKALTVVLGAKKWQIDQAALMDWFWGAYQKRVLADKGQEMGTADIPGAVGGKVRLVALKRLEAVVRKDQGAPKITLAKGVKAPVSPGQVLGEADFGGGLKAELTSDRYVNSTLQAGAWSAAALGACAVLGLGLHRTLKGRNSTRRAR